MTASISILLGASAFALVLSAFFHRKSRVLRQAIPEELIATIFDKTFNIYDVYSRHRGTLLNYAVPLFGICVYGTIVVGSFVIMKVLEMGLILSPAVFIICLAAIAITEALSLQHRQHLS